MKNSLPKLVTFDGEARSGKGTIASLVKDYLRDESKRSVMLIDAGQVFRVLVVQMMRDDIDLDDPNAIDRFLSDDEKARQCVQLVKDVYHMTKEERDALLYPTKVGVNSAKVGARPLSQEFKDELLRKWLKDASVEGFEVVLLDGRALEETGDMLVKNDLCDYVLSLFFIADPIVSAQRCLKRMPKPYDELDDDLKAEVDEFVAQIKERNLADMNRAVQPVVRPRDANIYQMIEIPEILPERLPRPAAIIDRSIEVPMDTMAVPIAHLVERYL